MAIWGRGSNSTPSTLRAALDGLATVMIIAVCAGLLWTMWRNRSAPGSPGKAGANAAGPSIPVPKDPLSLSGAEVKGSLDAKVAMIEFSDFQCPFCGMFARTTELQLAKEFVDSGQLLLAFRHMPLEPIHALALGAAEGAVCAGRQGRFWEMHDELFADQRALAKDAVSAKAKSLGLDVSSFEACIETDGKTQVRSDETSAGSLGVHGTPAFFIGIIQPDRTVKVRKVLTGATDAKVFEDAINEVYTAVRLERR